MSLVQNISQRIPQFHKSVSKTSAKSFTKMSAKRQQNRLNATNTSCLLQQLHDQTQDRARDQTCGVISLYAIEYKTAVVVVVSYHSVSRNPVRFKALVWCETPGWSASYGMMMLYAVQAGPTVFVSLRCSEVPGQRQREASFRTNVDYSLTEFAFLMQNAKTSVSILYRTKGKLEQ